MKTAKSIWYCTFYKGPHPTTRDYGKEDLVYNITTVNTKEQRKDYLVRSFMGSLH